MTGRDLAETFARWADEDETHTLPHTLPVIPLKTTRPARTPAPRPGHHLC